MLSHDPHQAAQRQAFVRRVFGPVRDCREEASVGVLVLFFQTADATSEAVIDKLTMFGEEVLPRILDI